MKKHLFIACLFASLLTSKAQDLPLSIVVPAISESQNVQFNVLHFDNPLKDQFSVLYFQTVYGSVLHEGEFVPDTGSLVFKDKKLREGIPFSNLVLFVKKQSFNAAGKLIETKDFFFSARPLDQEGEFKLYFPRGFKHPLVQNRMAITQSIYNIQSIPDFSAGEKAALVNMSKGYIPVQTIQNAPEPVRNENSIGNDLKQMKAQFKSLKQTGILAKGNLPSDEKILTRNGISDTRMFVITKTKGDNCLLKFYVTEDFKVYDLLDTLRINGDIQITSAATIFNTDNQPVGAYNNFVYKFKNADGEDVSRQYTFVMDPDYNIQSWMYSVGKDKLGSVAPEICWYEGNDLFVLSYNREKVFKSFVQVHQFSAGKDAQLLYPLNDAEKGTEKSGFVKTYQPPAPVGTGIEPIPEKYIPVKIFRAGNVRYMMMEGTRYDEALKGTRYLSLNIYRIENSGRLTNIYMLSDYSAAVPFPMTQIIRNKSAEYYLLAYPVKVQLQFTSEKCDITPLTADNTSLVPLDDVNYVQYSDFGSMMMKRSVAGNNYTVLYYPKD